VGETFTAASLEAARAYVQGQDMLAQGRQAAAIEAYQRAVAVDPDLGRAWAGLGAVFNNMGRLEDARTAYERALGHVDRMTDREKFRTRAAYYVVTRNPQKAFDEASALVQRFPADAAGLANLANAYFQRREFDKAVDIGRQAAAIYPSNVLRQSNVALFALYGGRFETALADGTLALKLNPDYPKAHLAVGLAQLAAGHVEDASAAYRRLSAIPAGATLAAYADGDLALFRGRTAAALEILAPAHAAETTPRAKARLALTMVEAHLARRETAKALDALRLSRPWPDNPSKFEAGRLSVAAGRPSEARTLAEELSRELDPETQALAEILAAEIALAGGDVRTAMARLAAARAKADSWWLRFTLGRAHLGAKQFAEADSEFDVCFRRRGEAVAVFMDDVPTWRHTASLHYYQGLARAGLNSAGAAESFKAFLAIKDGGDEAGGFVADARKRLGS
jgi:tetratricopeptide (TPR) repeat protein